MQQTDLAAPESVFASARRAARQMTMRVAHMRLLQDMGHHLTGIRENAFDPIVSPALPAKQPDTGSWAGRDLMQGPFLSSRWQRSRAGGNTPIGQSGYHLPRGMSILLAAVDRAVLAITTRVTCPDKAVVRPVSGRQPFHRQPSHLFGRQRVGKSGRSSQTGRRRRHQ